MNPSRGALALLLFACAGPPPHPPTAVIDATPEMLCEGDDFTTAIELSGERSSPALSLVPTPPEPGAPPLSMRWRLTGAAHVLDSGGLEDAALSVRAEGDRPLHVELTVEDEDGGSATTLRSIPIVRTTLDPCGDGCPEGARCEVVDGSDVCVPEAACGLDEDCPPCLSCDAEGRCVPR